MPASDEGGTYNYVYGLVLCNAISVLSFLFLITWIKCRNLPKQMKYLIVNMITVCCLSGPVAAISKRFHKDCAFQHIYWLFTISITQLTIILLLLDQLVSIYCPFWYARCSTARIRVITIISVLGWPFLLSTIAAGVIDWKKTYKNDCIEEMFYQLQLKSFCLVVSSTYTALSLLFCLLVWRKIRQNIVGPLGYLSSNRNRALVNVLIIAIFMSLFELLVLAAAIILQALDVSSGIGALHFCMITRGIGGHFVYGIFLPSLLFYRFKECRVQFIIIFCHCLPRLRTQAKQERTHIYMEAAGIPFNVANERNQVGNDMETTYHL